VRSKEKITLTCEIGAVDVKLMFVTQYLAGNCILLGFQKHAITPHCFKDDK